MAGDRKNHRVIINLALEPDESLERVPAAIDLASESR
jgi:hypothetical protein